MTSPYAQTSEVRLAEPTLTVTCVRCRAVYINDPDGRNAHRTVFGHIPATAETINPDDADQRTPNQEHP